MIMIIIIVINVYCFTFIHKIWNVRQYDIKGFISFLMNERVVFTIQWTIVVP